MAIYYSNSSVFARFCCVPLRVTWAVLVTSLERLRMSTISAPHQREAHAALGGGTNVYELLVLLAVA